MPVSPCSVLDTNFRRVDCLSYVGTEGAKARPARAKGQPPPLGVIHFRDLKIEADESLVSAEFLGMFFKTELGQKLVVALQQGTSVPTVAPDDLRALPVPVPSLEDQQKILATKRKIDELTKLLRRVEEELAVNPRNLQTVNNTITPMLQSLGKLSDADEVRECMRSGESKRVEFKQTFSLNTHTNEKDKRLEESSLKTIVAFLNSDGGDLLIGVHDAGYVTGLGEEILKFHKSTPDKFLLHMKNRIKADIGEHCYPLVDQRLVEIEGHMVLWVRCAASKKAMFYKGTVFYVRTNPATDQLEGEKMLAYISERFGQI